MKYAYVGYNWLHGKTAEDWSAEARIGMAQTIEIDEEEKCWPRYLAQVATERNGFFSSSDLGIVNIVRLPHQLGEIYSTVQNGAGYASRETDRWKDWATRVSITPFMHRTDLLRTLEIAPWFYTGTAASKNDVGGSGFRTGGLKKDRWGIFAGIRDPNLTAGVDYGMRHDETDNAPTPENPAQVVTETDGRLWSAFVVSKPLGLFHASTLPIGIVFRIDEFEPNDRNAAKAEYLVGGVTYDVGTRAQVAVDYQENKPLGGLSGTGATLTTNKLWYFHFTLRI